MAETVYVLCLLTSLFCAFLLFRSYRAGRSRLVFWSMLCFVGLAIDNSLLVLDRYWKTQRDRLFVFFALAFWCFTIGWSIRITTGVDEHRVLVFVPRLVGFLLIIVGIFDKNRR